MILPEEKRLPLLIILTHTDFEEQFLFREQLASLLEELTSHPDILISYHHLARIFSWLPSGVHRF
jgi:pterin-4a-carbinolamine dehydratase